MCMWDQDQEHKVELGGFISESGDGYTYARPFVGTRGSMPSMVDVPSGALAGFHTHPSGARYFSYGDVGWVRDTGIPLGQWGQSRLIFNQRSFYKQGQVKWHAIPVSQIKGSANQGVRVV